MHRYKNRGLSKMRQRNMFHTKEQDKTSEKGLNEVEKAFYLITISFMNIKMNTFNKLLVSQIQQN